MPGTLIQHTNFPSQHIPSRQIDVWLPPGYQQSDRPYPVIYMHDGQNLFYDQNSLAGIGWGIDEAMEAGIADGSIPPAIIVGIWNSTNRFGELMPYRPIFLGEHSEEDFYAWVEDFQPSNNEKLCADDTLKFIVRELKPFIDGNYRTLPDAADTFTMGSSMGALISIYTLCEYPEVFGGAGCLSTHWIVGNGIMFDYLAEFLPPAGGHRIYCDYGTLGLDAEYQPHQDRVDALLQERSYAAGVDWITRKFEGHDHSEKDWRKRVHLPLEFLLGAS